MTQKLLNVTEVSMQVGSSIQTITAWYKFRMEHPENDLVKLLPDYQHIGNRRTRYWNEADIGRLITFKNSIPQGRNGLMGSVTQKYVTKKGENRIYKTRVTIKDLVEVLRENNVDEVTIDRTIKKLTQSVA